MTSSNRAKFGYLTQEDMLLRIAEGQLDAYDIVFTKEDYFVKATAEFEKRLNRFCNFNIIIQHIKVFLHLIAPC